MHFFISICVCGCMCALVYVWMSEDSCQKPVLSAHHVGPGDLAEVIGPMWKVPLAVEPSHCPRFFLSPLRWGTGRTR